MKNIGNKNKFVVTKIVKETPDIVTISLSPTGRGLAHKAGQYVTVYLDDDENSRGKLYTISSSPTEKTLTISVKKIGQFSSALHDLKVKDAVYLSDSNGWFYPEIKMKKIVFLAAGIGITPFFSILKDYADKKIEKEIDLYYTNKTFKDIAFYKELNKLAKNDFVHIHCHLTRDNTKHSSISNYERIGIGNMKKELGNLIDRNFYICGPINFVSDMRKQLIKFKVKEKGIFTESFY
ncbi:MAG: FAD-dependent oxidoreductase [Bacteroidota bacterium]